MPLANLAASLVVTAPSPATSGLSLVVTTGEGALFPASTFYAVTHDPAVLPTSLTAEILKVVRTTDTFAITRAQRGTTAKSIATGWRIYQAILAEDIQPANRTVTGNDTLTDDDDVILLNATADLTLSLLPVAERKRPFYLKNIGTIPFSLTINPNGSETVDNQLTLVFTTMGDMDAYQIVPAAGEWWIF